MKLINIIEKVSNMQSKHKKLIVIAVLAFLFLLFLVMNNAGEKISRLGAISVNIATSLANASHGDPRPIEEMTVDYIKKNTGSSNTVNINDLPKAFVPLKKYGHAPFKMGACNICHAPKRSKPAAIITRTVSQLCFKCHEPKSRIDSKMKKLDCNKCHSPHQANRKKFLRDKVTQKECPTGKFI